ncbi:hypothetical protein SARC_03286 [Sphaeroforma arctica JP610]|uniref:Inositol polyphosphate-related phosphatase domain-containing protein n=1 Tax=Sphaeroforma arctica JP610 TaxID=667725 RepID=A0A0L0G673_9EUKA|nr:hypothetical protein SARC_03286 [Sphaeroforma arctica JP610]KNC84512.1 hypothetical protein SARC_03286 [Sphaeroforma arctica JP610]|eukprot:XP_014158414.1 hypothetical protein SARC_03286 [Sphaeroforma arctica JP610]
MLEELNIRVVTWNINALRTVPPLDDLLRTDKGPRPDVLAFGLQELSSDLIEASYFDDATGVLRQDWARKIQLHLGDGYMRAVVNRCGWAGLIVFLRKEIRPLIRRANTQQVTLGFNNLLGNKSGIATRFELVNGQSFTLVTAHFAAHQDKTYKRNDDYRRCCHYLTFGSSGKRESVYSQSHVIWFGDLNYRLECTYSMVKRCLTETEIASQKSLNKLLATDQLNDVRIRSLAFGGFSEAEISFTPTYKFIPGSDTYVGDRIPAWTDRVLYKGRNIRQLSYVRHARYRQSDHKPVSANFVFALHADVHLNTRSVPEMPGLTRVSTAPNAAGVGAGRRRYTDGTNTGRNSGMMDAVPTGDLLHIYGGEEPERCHSYPDTCADNADNSLTVDGIGQLEGRSRPPSIRNSQTPPPRPPPPYHAPERTSNEGNRSDAPSNTGGSNDDARKQEYYRVIADSASPTHGPYSSLHSLDERPGSSRSGSGNGHLASGEYSDDKITPRHGKSGDEIITHGVAGLNMGTVAVTNKGDLIVLDRERSPEALQQFDPLYGNSKPNTEK